MDGKNAPVPTFWGPLPGQSLTDKPGNAPWEHPPQYTNAHKACQFIFSQLMDPKIGSKTLMLLKGGAPIEWVAHSILFGGFSKGMWTPDLIVAMTKPVVAMLIMMAKKAGIKYRLKINQGADTDLIELGQLLKKDQKNMADKGTSTPLDSTSPDIVDNDGDNDEDAGEDTDNDSIGQSLISRPSGDNS